MKFYLFPIITIILFGNAFSQNNEKNIENIDAFMNQWHQNVAKFQFEEYFNKMSANGIFIGTDASENWTIPEFKKFAKPFFDKKKTWDFKPLERNIYVSNDNNFAWFDELLNTWMGICRGSGVLKKENNKWKIVHYVLSVTIPNDNMKKVIELKKVNDSLILTEFKN